MELTRADAGKGGESVTTNATPRAERRVPLSRARVLRAAFDRTDKDGVEALSMRKLAQALGVEAMSLYRHVRNKGDIVDGMVDLVFAEIGLPAADVDWKTAMRRRAISAREVLARHPWAIALMEAEIARCRMAVFQSTPLGAEGQAQGKTVITI